MVYNQELSDFDSYKAISTKLFFAFSIAYCLIFLTSFAVVPIIFAGKIFPEYVSLLASLTAVSTFSYLIGLNLKFGRKITFPVIVVDFSQFLTLIFALFLIIITVILITAPRIPIIESIKGASSDELSQYREDFLKGRKGWEASLGYIVGAINTYILPYLIAIAFLQRHILRFIVSAIFIIYCISFLEKAYFLKLAIPLFFIFFYQSRNKILFVSISAAIIFALFFLMYLLAGINGSSITRDESFFSILYTPGGTIETIVWRATVVPIVSAIDGIRLFISEYGGNYFLGRSSSFLAFLTGSERINFERALYQDQFGGQETGNVNQFYIVEAYINFSYIGVILFSFIVGRIIRFSITNRDFAMQAVMPLFLFNLFNTGLIGNFFSNGLLFFYFMIRFIKFKFFNN